MLKECKSPKPNPPHNFGMLSFSQLCQDIPLLSPPAELHQKQFINLSMSLHNCMGKRNRLIVYVGMACTTALISTSLPSRESNFPRQLLNFFIPGLYGIGKHCICSFLPWMGDPNTDANAPRGAPLVTSKSLHVATGLYLG